MFEVRNLYRSAFAGGHTTWVYTGEVDPDVYLETFFKDILTTAEIKSGDLLIIPDASRIRFIYISEDGQLCLVKPL